MAGKTEIRKYTMAPPDAITKKKRTKAHKIMRMDALSSFQKERA